MATTSTINAKHLELVLATRRMASVGRWCVMSAHRHTQPCNRRGYPYRIAQGSVAGPMTRGNLKEVIERVAGCGAKEVRRTFAGAGIRALRAEVTYTMPATP